MACAEMTVAAHRARRSAIRPRRADATPRAPLCASPARRGHRLRRRARSGSPAPASRRWAVAYPKAARDPGCKTLDRRLHELAGRRRELRPLHLHRADPRHRRADRRALPRRARRCSSTGFLARRGVERGADPAAAVLDRGDRHRRRCSASRPAAGGSRCSSAGCFLYLAVFGQWQSAMVTLASIAHRGAARRRRRAAPRHRRLPLAALRAGDARRCST